MSLEYNQALNRRYFEELLGKGDMVIANELLDERLLFHGSRVSVEGVDAFKKIVQLLHHIFANQHYAIEDEVVTEDRVITRWRWVGTHVQEYMDIPPTGNQVTAWGISINHIVAGKIVETWEMWSSFSLLQQPGARSPIGRG